MLNLRKAFTLSAVVLIVSFFSVSGCNNNKTSLGPPFQNPKQISSVDGVLEITYDADVSPAEVDGKSFMSAQYNGMLAPPTLRVNPGDTIKLTLNNFLDMMTNVHYHGMNVSPLSPSDDVFIMITPNSGFEYEVQIPEDHPEGMFYYHAHLFGITEFQIMSGLSGGLIVEGILDPFPQLQGITEQIMYLKDFQLVDGEIPPEGMIDPSGPTNFTVNGQTNPTITMRPGETQFWQIGNIGADLYYDLVLDDHIFYQIERDGNRRNQTIERTEILMPTSSRVGVLVQANQKPGLYKLRARKFSTGPQGDQYGGATLLTVKVEGEPVENPIALPIPMNQFPVVENLCEQEIAVDREIVFSETADGNTFFINGKEFDPERVDTEVKIGDFERWTVTNTSGELHVFHIHLTDFVVCSVNGVQQPFVGKQDTVNVPYQGQDPDFEGPGEVVIVIDFTNSIIEGKAVYHCHIGEHEDNGMMAVFEACAEPPCPDFEE
jgi:FtsP/CotA-like multicopper oxidase with cupredoxin domain